MITFRQWCLLCLSSVVMLVETLILSQFVSMAEAPWRSVIWIGAICGVGLGTLCLGLLRTGAVAQWRTAQKRQCSESD